MHIPLWKVVTVYKGEDLELWHQTAFVLIGSSRFVIAMTLCRLLYFLCLNNVIRKNGNSSYIYHLVQS